MEFSAFVITNKGQALMAKLLQGTGMADFTAIKLSSHTYSASELQALTALADVKQTAPITSKTVVNPASILIQGAVDNRELNTGYNIQTIGVYAVDPDDGEILYAVARATTAGYMPPYNGVAVSGGVFKFTLTVGSAAQVTLTVDPAGYASIGDVQALQDEISDVKGYIGYTDGDIYGVEVDFTNRTFTRLAGAVGKTPGASFDGIGAFGGRYRCNLTDGGVEVAKFGDAAYSETGALTQAVEVDGVTYAVGTAVQVMVKQPRFYYKVVPLKLDKIEGGAGYHMRKARYYVSMIPKAGFKIHPLFKHNGVLKDYVYLSAYEGSLYDVSASAYILNDAQVADFTSSTGDKLCSIAGAKPLSGLTQDATRRKVGILAENRGSGWLQSFAASAAATQMLFLIEYASFNMQSKLGNGATAKTDDGSTNMAEATGATTNLGNQSGNAANGNDVQFITYRGEENFYGNIWKWVDGINLYADKDAGHNKVYVADHSFTESKNNDQYKDVGFVTPGENGYVNAFGYSEEFDWLFLTSEVGNGASTSVPVGDYYYQNVSSSGYRVAKLGATWADGLSAGGFCWTVDAAPSLRYRGIGGRLAYVPGVA